MKKLLTILFILFSFTAMAQPCADEDTVRSNAVTLITATTARVNGSISHFTAGYTTLYLIYVRVGQIDTATASGVSPLRNLTGLVPNTQYYYYYKTICVSGTNRQLGPYYFTTAVNTISYATERSTVFPYVKTDSGFRVPRADTSLYRAPTSTGGDIVFKSSDNTMYYWNGTRWTPMAIDSAGMLAMLNDKVDSVTVDSNYNRLYYWKNGGISYGYVLPGDSGYVRTVAINDSTQRYYRLNGDSSDIVIRGSGGGGSDSAVRKGYGTIIDISGTSRILSVDSLQLSTRAWRQKGMDSLGAIKAGYVDVKDTIQKVLNYLVLNNVSDFAGFMGFANSVIVKDTLRGDRFDIYTGPDAADNGMIFEDALGRKWLRSTVNDLIHTKWYGLNTLSTRIDNYTAITKARDYIYAHPTFKTLHIDANAGGVGIYRLYQIKFTQAINIEGDFTTGDLPATKISFLMNSNGLVFQPYNYNFSISVSNLSIENEFDYLTRDTSKALIKSHCLSYIKNVRMPYVSGVGIELSGCIDGDSTTNPIFGNCDFSYIENCNVYESLHGYKTAGCDANSITFLNCLSQAAVRWGIKDSGQLGNHYINCHFQGNSNNSISGAATQVSYAGKYYAALTAHDDGSGIGKRPDLNLFTYWVERDPCAAAAWDTTKHYWSGGAITVENPNATTNISNPYIEVDDGIIILNSRSDVTGGTNGVGVVVGGSRRWTSLGIYTIASSVRIQDTGNPNTTNTFGVNAEPLGSEMARIKNKVGINTPLSLEGFNGFSLMNFANVGYPTTGVQVGSYYGEFRVYPKLGEGFSADEIALMPQNHNTYDLGKSGQAWKQFYAMHTQGAGTKAVRMNSATGQHFYIDTTTYSVGFGLLQSVTYPNIHYTADTSELSTVTALRDTGLALRALIAAGGANLANTNLAQTGGNRTYSGGNQNLSFNGGGSSAAFGVEYHNGINLTSQNSTVAVQGDSIILQSENGIIHVDSLPQSVSPTIKMVGWDSISKKLVTQAIPSGGSGATAAQLRRFGSTDVTGTDANITAAAGNVIYLPAATLSTGRTIDVTALNTDGDFIEIYNSEAGFTWSFTGATVYLLDRTTTVTTLVVDAVYKIRRVSGKLIINN